MTSALFSLFDDLHKPIGRANLGEKQGRSYESEESTTISLLNKSLKKRWIIAGEVARAGKDINDQYSFGVTAHCIE